MTQPRIEIPEEASVGRAIWPDRPSENDIQEFLDHVMKTGQPFTWKGITHNRPPEGSTPTYIAEFSIPEKIGGRYIDMAPCPCCWIDIPKYRYAGKLAWFHEEAVLRALGPDCFRGFNAEGHQQALDQWNAEQKRIKTTHYIVERLPLVPKSVKAVEHNLVVAVATDKLYELLHSAIKPIANFELWNHVRGGELMLESGVRYSTIQGYRMLNPTKKPKLESRFQEALDILRLLLNQQDFTEETSQEELEECEHKLKKAFKILDTVMNDLREYRSFIKVETIATLRTWATQDQCPVELFIERTDMRLRIGRFELAKRSIKFPDHLEESILEIPKPVSDRVLSITAKAV